MWSPTYAQIQLADFIVVADAEEAKSSSQQSNLWDKQWVLKPVEILKGKRGISQPEIRLPYAKYMREGPHIEKGRQVFLLKREASQWNLIEIYREASIPFVRCLVRISSEGPEPNKIKEMSSLMSDPEKTCQSPLPSISTGTLSRELNAAIQSIRDPASFDTVSTLLPQWPIDVRKNSLEWMAQTLDSRAIPILIQNLESSDKWIAIESAQHLARYYAGNPDTTSTFHRLLNSPNTDLKNIAVRYLEIWDSTPEVKNLSKSLLRPTPFMEMEQIFKEGSPEKAKETCLHVIQDEKMDDYQRKYFASCIGKTLTRKEQNKVLPAFLPFLEHLAGQGSWLDAKEALDIVKTLDNPACLNTLLLVLQRKDFYGLEPRYDTVMAISRLGPEARKQSVGILTGLTEEAVQGHNYSMDKFWPLLALGWVGDGPSLKNARQVLKKGGAPKEYVYLTEALKGIHGASDEGAVLIDFLKRKSEFPYGSPEWFVLRLGDLKDQRATEQMVALLKGNTSGPGTEVYVALRHLGPSSTLALKKLVQEDPLRYREAVSLLCEGDKDNLIASIRGWVASKPEVVPPEGWSCLGAFGTESDLKLLALKLNYWSDFSGFRYWALDAYLALGSRYKKDLTNVQPTH